MEIARTPKNTCLFYCIYTCTSPAALQVLTDHSEMETTYILRTQLNTFKQCDTVEFLKLVYFTASVLHIRKLSRGVYFRETSQMRRFVKIKPPRNCIITLLFTDIHVGKSDPCPRILTSQIRLLTLFAKIKYSLNLPDLPGSSEEA